MKSTYVQNDVKLQHFKNLSARILGCHALVVLDDYTLLLLIIGSIYINATYDTYRRSQRL